MMGSNCFRIPRSLHYLFKLSVNGIDGEEKKQEKEKKSERKPKQENRRSMPSPHYFLS